MLRKIVLLTLTAVFCLSVTGQDANYWNSNYGPGAFFTPGAVVAYNKDSGVFFFNPALMGLSTKSSTTISANIYQLSNTKIKDGVGTGKDLLASNTAIVPLMVSGSISIRGKKPFTVGYALMNQPVVNYITSQRLDAQKNVLDDSYSPGNEFFIGQYSEQNRITQTTGILSFGIKLSERWAAGLSIEGMLHKQNYDVGYSARAIVNAPDSIFPPLSSFVVNYMATYVNVNMRFKAGVAYNEGRHHAGLTVSTPTLRIAGTGTLLSDIVISNIRSVPANINISLLANARQENLTSRHRMPVSIAGGYAFDFNNGGQIYFAAEYFNRLKDYNVLSPRGDYFIRPDTGENNKNTTSQLRLRDSRKAITNFAIGLALPVKQNVMGYVSARTDFNYDNLPYDEEGYTPNISSWNIYHMQLGVNVKKRKFNLRTGLLLSYGVTSKHYQQVNFDNPDESNFLLGVTGQTKARHYTLGVMFSYIHNL
ncbi:hypothetical protein [Foetidibacter luteolus]|uniref:hypothetical protein n=1 Tax=Foetidibacter luteolus TaxID=2608880 RepID=UPI00129AE9C1|nr:hypothetical protein [Foetidibacter luteolus]